MSKPKESNLKPNRRNLLKAVAGGGCALGIAGLAGKSTSAHAQTAQKGLIGRRRSEWFSALDNGNIRCELCPKRCAITPGRRGPCRVRENRSGTGYTLVYGNPCLVQIDPVERKPFFHVLPGTRALSVSTAGCPLECGFCEVWDMALVGPEDVHAFDFPPEKVVQSAKEADVRSLSYAFGEPVAFFEYMADIAGLAKEADLLNLLHTSGYITEKPLSLLCGVIDAANVDLKGFDAAFYRDVCGGELETVLDTLEHLKARDVHIEITNILIPTLNDDMGQIRRMCSWIRDELSAQTPVHFARFYPLYKLANLPPTPVSTIDRARAVALDEGLEYVYVARVTGHEGESTFCPSCKQKVIERLGFVIETMNINTGNCSNCGHPIPGRWS